MLCHWLHDGATNEETVKIQPVIKEPPACNEKIF